MDTTGKISSFAAQGKDLTDKAADKAQKGLDNATDWVDDVGDTLSSKVERARNRTKPAIDRVAARAQSLAQQGRDATDGLVTYTKENPLTALLLAGVAGALLVTLVNILTPSRD